MPTRLLLAVATLAVAAGTAAPASATLVCGLFKPTGTTICIPWGPELGRFPCANVNGVFVVCGDH